MSLHMNPDVRAAWCAALRSGGYRQGRRYLRDVTGRGSVYCCLGVLTDLAVKAGAVAWDDIRESAGFLPEKVAAWAEVDAGDVLIAGGDGEEDPRVYATEANDVLDWDFAAIADAIDGGKP